MCVFASSKEAIIQYIIFYKRLPIQFRLYSKFAPFINLKFKKSYYNWLKFPILLKSKKHSQIMNRYMKNNKFDFFQSPHPRTKDFYNLVKDRDCLPLDSENNDVNFFQTPVRLNSFCPFSPYVQNEHCSSEMTANKKGYYEELFMENMSNIDSLEEYQQSISSINQKLQYSQQLLINLTPSKNPIIDHDYLDATVKKEACMFSSPNQARFYQRGLKKLAFEAFNFVSTQKKTTYKQVAKKLINQLSDQNSTEIQRKGQMNIKRRVYDALNVLIALGLLKRNGNKIIGKKLSSDFLSLEADAQKEKLKKKEQNLVEQFDSIKGQCDKKQCLVIKKKKRIQIMKHQIKTLRALTQRNQREMVFEAKKCISMPFFRLSVKQPQLKHEKMDLQLDSDASKIYLKQQNAQKIYFKYPFSCQRALVGDADMLIHLPTPQVACLSPIKLDRNKKIKLR